MPDSENMVPLLPEDAAHARETLAERLIVASALVDPAAVATLTVKHLRDLGDTDGAALYWWDDIEQVLLPLAVLDPRASRLHQVFHPGQGATGTAFSTGSPVIANDYPSDISFPPAWKVAERVRAVAAVPLRANGEICGVLTLTQHHDARLTQRHIDLMTVIGDQVAPTLHGMRALAHAQFRLAEARELTSLIRETASNTDSAPVLERICELACRLLGSDFAGIVLPLDGDNLWAAAYGNSSNRDDWPSEAPGWPLLPGLRAGETILLTDLGRNPEWPMDAMPVFAAESLRTAVAVPLAPADGDVFGGLILGWRFELEPSGQLLGLARTLGASATSLLIQARTAAALREGDQLWRLTLDNAPVGICLVHLDGKFRLVNAAMTRILGYSEKELLSRDFLSLTHPAYVEKKKELLERVLRSGNLSETIQTRCLHADGHGVWTSLSVQLVCDDRGKPAYFAAQLEDVNEQHEQTAQLMHLATHDSHTGLANRHLFYELLDERVQRAGETVVALLDVPELHGLDDRFGHLAAGEIVRELARRLVDAVHGTSLDQPIEAPDESRDEQDAVDCVARLASDEFGAMLTARPGDNVEGMVTQRLVTAFRTPFVFGGRSHSLSVHVGVASGPSDGATAQDLLRSADIALTNARRDGRAFRLYTPTMGQAETHRQRLILDLRTVLKEHGLSMVFQPIIDAPTRQLLSAEGLARWTHPEFGSIGPDTFVPLAEESGLMPALTEWALDTALAACGRWQLDKPGVAVAVNLSASDLQNSSVAELIAAALTKNKLAPRLLEVELTETTVMTDLTIALAMLDNLSQLGVGLGIDDFGTGYSSLAYLQRLPMVALKIDRSFVTTMLTDPSNAAIVRMIIQLARTLGMVTVAEGVEDAATGRRLTELRCDRLQGYGIARPMSEQKFALWTPDAEGDGVQPASSQPLT